MPLLTPSANPGDFLTVIDAIGQITPDGPLAVPLEMRDDGVANLGWVYADAEAAHLTTMDIVPIRELGGGVVRAAAVLCEARYDLMEGVQVSVSRFLGTLDGVLPHDRSVFDMVAGGARPLRAGSIQRPEAVYAGMVGIAQTAVDYALQHQPVNR